NTNRPRARPPASAFQTRPACTAVKPVAEGKAAFWASGIERYWTAWAAEVMETTAAAGAVHFIQSDIVHMRPCCPDVRRSRRRYHPCPPPWMRRERQKKNPPPPRNESEFAPAGSLLMTF